VDQYYYYRYYDYKQAAMNLAFTPLWKLSLLLHQ